MIRPYKNGDLEQCARVMIEAYNDPPWNDQWTIEKAERFLQDFTDNKRFFGFTLWEDGELIGATFCREMTWWTKDEVFIEEFYILPRFQRKGCGKQLLLAIEGYIKGHSLGGYTLLTNRTMPALEFYKKNGVIPSENVVYMYKDFD